MAVLMVSGDGDEHARRRYTGAGDSRVTGERESSRRAFAGKKRNDDKGPVTSGEKACGSLAAGANDRYNYLTNGFDDNNFISPPLNTGPWIEFRSFSRPTSRSLSINGLDALGLRLYYCCYYYYYYVMTCLKVTLYYYYTIYVVGMDTI